MLLLKVKDIVYDISLNPVVLLVDESEKKVLPIWVGPLEAHVIALFINNVEINRPLTHDLMKSICERLNVKVNQVVISDIRDGTYYAELYLRKNDHEQLILDARPSDAIALALRSSVPIYLHDKVADHLLSIEELSEEQQEELKKILEANRPDIDKKHLH